ncbi:MAG: hypothetical protein WCL21_08695 [Mariniphaga sp.]
MKNKRFWDLVFIINCGTVISLITYFGYSKLLSQYALVFALISYYIGKYIARVELRKKME